MEINFNNHDDFEKFFEEQGEWIYDGSVPEHYMSAYMLEKSIKYKDGKVVEYIYLIRSGNIFTNHISMYHLKGEQPHQIWSGRVNTPDEYKDMMSAVNKYIDETKPNSGVI